MITLSSDFGWPYPAAMRGVIAGRTDARILDVTHQFPRGDLRTAAFWLAEVLPWFPPAVHVVVVDPGVGTDRRVLAIEAGDHVLVGPDNGVMMPAARALAADVDCWVLRDPSAASSTFHGRDVFAPLGADIDAQDVPMVDREDLHPVDDPVDLRLPTPTVESSTATGEVLVVDGFGNAITNVPGRFLAERFGGALRVNDRTAPVRRTYAAVEDGERLVTVGSHDRVELAVRNGRGERAFDVDVGSTVRFAPP